MNAVEIADAVDALFREPFDAAEFPFAFLEAYGIKGATVKRLRTGNNNPSDVDRGVLLRNNVHLAVCAPGAVGETLRALKASPQTARAKAKFALATDGEEVGWDDLRVDVPAFGPYEEFSNYFGTFLELAGISTVREIKDNPIDIRATGRLNKLYLELLGANEAWRAEARRPDLNHFFARLIFCLFAEDTGIFHGESLFTKTVDRMTESDGSNVHEVLETLFQAMNTSLEARKAALKGGAGVPRVQGDDRAPVTRDSPNSDPWVPRVQVDDCATVTRAPTNPPDTGSGGTNPPPAPMAPSSIASPGTGYDGTNPPPAPVAPVAPLPLWAEPFPYVNGGLFSGSPETPRFTRLARAYLRSAGELDWRTINPDIFGSMIQAVADDEERGALGMHYTSVPNILKVLNPLFLDDLRAQLERAGEHKASLLRLRERMARIRVFDPACGSGNFLVIAYKQMRGIEAEANRRRGEADRPSEIPLTNFRGIEIRDFAAEVARLALIIAEYQADVTYRGERLALAEFLPLKRENWIWRGNALRLDWTTVCPPTGDVVRVRADNLFEDRLEQTEMDFANAGGETYLCSNPPYLGFTWQTAEQKSELESVFKERTDNWKSFDYVAAWFLKAAEYSMTTEATTAFVATNSICQGQLVPMLWPLLFSLGQRIVFAHTSFKWANLATSNAGVTVVIVGMGTRDRQPRQLFSSAKDGSTEMREAKNINAYLLAGADVVVSPISLPLDNRAPMVWGNKPSDGGHLLLSQEEKVSLLASAPSSGEYLRRFVGAEEFIQGKQRHCIWISDDRRELAMSLPEIERRIQGVALMRQLSKAAETRKGAAFPHRFRQIQAVAQKSVIVVPGVSSENRTYLPVGLESERAIIGHKNFALYDAPLWSLALIASRLHWVWIGTVCVRMRTDFSYSNTLGWNTFPVPPLTANQREELTRCAEGILLAREAHFPATIADLYDPERMPEDLRRAHERNDETLERIFVGRRFRNDTERLEHLFERYVRMREEAKGEEERGKRRKGKRAKAAEGESLL